MYKNIMIFTLFISSIVYAADDIFSEEKDKPYITLPEGKFGISALFERYPTVAKPMRELAQVLLRDIPCSLTPAEREIIATRVSYNNHCDFCYKSHAAAAIGLLPGNPNLTEVYVKRIIKTNSAPISEKLHMLISIADGVQEDCRQVKIENIKKAKSAGATEDDIHTTIAIAAAFSMFNRYVDGHNTPKPDDLGIYNSIGKRLALEGYVSKESQ